MSATINPTFFQGGSTPHRNDSRWFVWQRILGALENGSTSLGGYAGDYGGVAPNFTPTQLVAIAFDTITGTQWNFYEGVWH